MADAPSMPHPAFVPPPLFGAELGEGGDDGAGAGAVDLRARLRERAPFDRRYVRQRPLAGGQMSVLHLCRDELIGRAVALKTLAPERASIREAELRFLREAAIQGQLEHPAIVPVYDLGVDDEGSIYFTMKRIRGIGLDEILDGLAWDRAGFRAEYTRHRLLRALASVCLAVDFAHHRGIIHRDLKPSNIMLGDFGEVYVLDWGLARIDPGIADQGEGSGRRPAAAYYALRTLPGALLGTPGYMAPEQLGAAEEVGPAADVYALGSILFEILTGARLHDDDQPAARVRSTIQGTGGRPSERAPDLAIPPELDAICEEATRLSPERRYAGPRALHDALDRFLAGARDHELRRALADEHIAAAGLEETSAGDPTAASRRAIRELSRALALDPGSEAATAALLRLLADAPSEVPPEVERAASLSRDRYWQRVARLAGVVYASMFLYAPFLVWSGVRDPVPLLLFYILIALSAALSFWVSRQARPAGPLIVAVLGASNLAFSILSGLAGPLLVVPMVIAVNTGGFALLLGRRLRGWILAWGVLAILGPLALELVGLLPPSYEFIDGALVIRSRIVSASPLPTLTFLSLVAVSTIVTTTMVFSELREGVLRAERRFLLYGWQLRQLLPWRVG